MSNINATDDNTTPDLEDNSTDNQDTPDNTISSTPVDTNTAEVKKEVVKTDDNNYEQVIRVTPKDDTSKVVVDTNNHFSNLDDHKVGFDDFYQDTRTFLAKANSTKFILVSFLVLLTPILLVYSYISQDVFKEMIMVISLAYLGIDTYEKKALIKK